MAKYIDLKTDFGFKRLFARSENKMILLDFLNSALLGELDNPIKEVEIKNPEILGPSPKDRKVIFDLFCITSNGKHIIVEMQRANQLYFKERSLFYAASAIIDQGKRGDWNYNLSPVFTICITDFPIIPNDQRYLVNIGLGDQQNLFFKHLNFLYLVLPNFTKNEEDCTNNLDKWLYLLKNLEFLNHQPTLFSEQVFQIIFKLSDIKSLSNKERNSYKRSQQELKKMQGALDYALQHGFETRSEKKF